MGFIARMQRLGLTLEKSIDTICHKLKVKNHITASKDKTIDKIQHQCMIKILNKLRTEHHKLIHKMSTASINT